MRKSPYMPLTVLALVFATALVASGAEDPHGRPGFQGHAEVPAHHGSFDHPGVHPHSGIRERHGFGDHHDFGHHPRTRVFVAPGFWWAPDWWGPDYPSFAAPPVYGPPQTLPQPYWFYCQDAQGYYPYVQQCPGGWQPVVPSPLPAG